MTTLAMVGTIVAADLYVIHPHSLARKFDFNRNTYKGALQASLSHYGTFDKQSVFMGRVHYPLLNTDGCNPFEESDFDEQHLKETSMDGHKLIIMVDSGNCHFV